MTKMNNNISFVTKILKKAINHYIFKNILILFFAGLFILYGTLVALRHYTHHGESITVPDVTGLTLSEAVAVLRMGKMQWQLSDSVYVGSVKPGAIVNQNPESGSSVKENRNVFLVINAVAPEKIKMPNVVGVSLRQAKSTLEAQGLKLGKTTYVPDIARDYVLKQRYRGAEIRRGTEIVKGAEIELVLGDGLETERSDTIQIKQN